jgi:hypothetical protein
LDRAFESLYPLPSLYISSSDSRWCLFDDWRYLGRYIKKMVSQSWRDNWDFGSGRIFLDMRRFPFLGDY